MDGYLLLATLFFTLDLYRSYAWKHVHRLGAKHFCGNAVAPTDVRASFVL